MNLSDIKENQSALITQIRCVNLSLRRLSDLGFCAGEEILCTHKNPLGSPIAYTVGGNQIAIRKSDAARIGVVL